MAIDYKQAGVDIEAGDALVQWLKTNQPKRWPHQERLVKGIGGFSALFRVGFPDMKSPCLVSSTDGVGTKLKLASHFERYQEVAQDLVAMCVNDLICCGAQPLFFLDYYASGKLRLEAAKEFLTGLQQACIESECALIGGETAEMPGVYADNDFDCAGFSVGVVDEDQTLGAHRVTSGDRLLAISSSGFHSNGFSLLRKVFAEDLADWEDLLLRPTALYVKTLASLRHNQGVHAVANITGGGIDNLLRVLPEGFRADIDPWEIPAEFVEVKSRSGLSWESMLKTLNCGLGMVLVVDPAVVDVCKEEIKKSGHTSIDLGEVSAAQGPATWRLTGGLNHEK